MSGYGVAADPSGNLYFATGNSDPSGSSYNTYNLSESIVKVAPDLTKVLGFFSPSDGTNSVTNLDQQDLDTGSGGVMLLPDQGANTPALAVHAGKVGQMYLLNRDNLGGYDPTTGTNHVLGTFSIGGCWCGPSYFQGSDTAGRVVSSGGNTVMVWRVQKGKNPTLVLASRSAPLSSGQDPGFFTTVSSNGTQNTIIWAVTRPVYSSNPNVTLYAFDANSNQLINPIVAGIWPNTGFNANIVPVVANGHVYVAAYSTVAIFGLGPSGALTAVTPPQPAVNGHEIYGTITALDGALLTLQTRTGTLVSVDATAAIADDQSVNLKVDKPVRVVGDFNPVGVLLATAITHAKNSPESWPPDH